jgi:hypothetical protein
VSVKEKQIQGDPPKTCAKMKEEPLKKVELMEKNLNDFRA